MGPTITPIKTVSSEYSKYFWHRCNVAWPFQSKQNNIHIMLTASTGGVIQEERSVFLKVLVLAIVTKKFI
jgi:hypothetical protein